MCAIRDQSSPFYLLSKSHYVYYPNSKHPITDDHLMTISDREKVERSDVSMPFESRTAVPFLRLLGFNETGVE